MDGFLFFRSSTQEKEKLIPLSFEQAAQTNKVIPVVGDKKPEPKEVNSSIYTLSWSLESACWIILCLSPFVNI